MVTSRSNSAPTGYTCILFTRVLTFPDIIFEINIFLLIFEIIIFIILFVLHGYFVNVV